MLSGLRHRTICCSYYQDRAVHLRSTGDHVLNVVSVARAVYVCVVSVRCFVFYVRGGDGDTSFSFFRSLVDLVEFYVFAQAVSLVQYFGDRRGQRGLTMVNVADGTDVNMRFGSFKFLFCHFNPPDYITLFFGSLDLGVPKSPLGFAQTYF